MGKTFLKKSFSPNPFQKTLIWVIDIHKNKNDKKFLGDAQAARLSHATVYKIRLFAFSNEISQWIFVKIHCENAEFGSLRDPGLLQVENLQQPQERSPRTLVIEINPYRGKSVLLHIPASLLCNTDQS